MVVGVNIHELSQNTWVTSKTSDASQYTVDVPLNSNDDREMPFRSTVPPLLSAKDSSMHPGRTGHMPYRVRSGQFDSRLSARLVLLRPQGHPQTQGCRARRRDASAISPIGMADGGQKPTQARAFSDPRPCHCTKRGNNLSTTPRLLVIWGEGRSLNVEMPSRLRTSHPQCTSLEVSLTLEACCR